MTDEELIARLRERAAEERDVQRNNEAVAAALMGQRLLFDQGIRSKANSFAVRLGLEHESCAKNDAKLARDWDAAANRIEALVAENAEYEEVFDMQWKAGMRAVERWREAHPGNDLVLPDTADLCLWLLARVERLEEALKPSGDTKAAYMGEFFFPQTVTGEDDEEVSVKVFVPWDTVKQIMAAIRERALLKGDDHV